MELKQADSLEVVYMVTQVQVPVDFWCMWYFVNEGGIQLNYIIGCLVASGAQSYWNTAQLINSNAFDTERSLQHKARDGIMVKVVDWEVTFRRILVV
jgi:hypothetical protein